MAMDPRIDEVLEFWFGDGSPEAMSRWFTRDDAFDREIRERFGALHAEAAAGGLEHWRGTARGELALIVVLDQFSRNLYRDDPRAFAQDDRALAIARDLVESGRLGELLPHERAIALMPYQHSEDRDVQRESVRLFGELAAERPDDEMLATNLDFAKQHAVIVERFLNDVTPAPGGGVYVSDSSLDASFKSTGDDAIYHVGTDGKVKPLIKNKKLGGPNGITTVNDLVWVVTFGSGEMYNVDAKGKQGKAEKLPSGQLDGVVALEGGEFLVSSWEGSTIYRGKPGGEWTPAIQNVKSPADIGYDSKRKRVLIPVFTGDTVILQPLE